MTITVGALLERARAHHPAFETEQHPNRVLLSILSTRHRAHLKRLVEHLKDRFTEARTIADTIAGSLVGVDENGASFSVTTDGDGFDVIVDDNGYCYTGPTAIAQDPYVTGFPLPTTALKIVDVYATMNTTDENKGVDILPQRDYPRLSGAGKLHAVINGWRLIPLLNPPDLPSGTGLTAADQTLWASVNKVTVVWVEEPTRFTETGAWQDQELSLPDTYADALELELAAALSRRAAALTDGFPAGLVAVYDREAAAALAEAVDGARLDHKHLRFSHARRNR